MAYPLNGNLKAFLQVIRHCEGTAGPNGYRTLFGGKLFDSFDRHPAVYTEFTLKGKKYTSSAAGAYQFLKRTWDSLVKQNGFKDFSPDNQDQGAVALIRGRGALRDVEEGRFEAALTKCNREWASLPGSPYGQPVKTVAYCKQIYEQFGGEYMVAPLVAAVAMSAAKPFVTAAFEALAKELPTLGKIFGSGSEVSNRNLQAAEAVVNIVKDTIGAKNEQEAVELVRSDPEARKAADDAVRANAFELFGMDFSNVGEAREFDRKLSEAPEPFYKNSPAFWISILSLPLPYYVVYRVLTGPLEFFSNDVRASIASAVISLVLGGIIGFWLGASFTTSKSRGLNATPTQ